MYVRQAKNKLVMLKVLKELTGKGQAFPAFGADEPDLLRDRRSLQVSASLLISAYLLLGARITH